MKMCIIYDIGVKKIILPDFPKTEGDTPNMSMKKPRKTLAFFEECGIFLMNNGLGNNSWR